MIKVMVRCQEGRMMYHRKRLPYDVSMSTLSKNERDRRWRQFSKERDKWISLLVRQANVREIMERGQGND